MTGVNSIKPIQPSLPHRAEATLAQFMFFDFVEVLTKRCWSQNPQILPLSRSFQEVQQLTYSGWETFHSSLAPHFIGFLLNTQNAPFTAPSIHHWAPCVKPGGATPQCAQCWWLQSCLRQSRHPSPGKPEMAGFRTKGTLVSMDKEW